MRRARSLRRPCSHSPASPHQAHPRRATPHTIPRFHTSRALAHPPHTAAKEYAADWKPPDTADRQSPANPDKTHLPASPSSPSALKDQTRSTPSHSHIHPPSAAKRPNTPPCCPPPDALHRATPAD